MNIIKNDIDLMRTLLENFDKEPNYAAMKGPGDFEPPDEVPPEMPKVREALGDVEALRSRLRRVVRLFKSDPKEAIAYFNQSLPKVERFLDDVYSAFEEGEDTKQLMDISDAFNKVDVDENGELIEVQSAEQLNKFVTHTEKTLNTVESSLEDFLDQ